MANVLEDDEGNHSPHIPQQDDEQVAIRDDTDGEEDIRLVLMVCTHQSMS